MIRASICVCVALFLGGCASIDSGSVPRGLPELPAEKAGVVFGSVGVGGPSSYNTVLGLRYRAKGSQESALILSRQSGIVDTPMDFSDGSAKGRVFAIRLPPGEYELYSVYLLVNRSRFDTSALTSKIDFDIPFTVAAGSATYLGEFVGHSESGENVVGIPMPLPTGYFVVSNKLERDFSFLSKKQIPIPRERVRDVAVSPQTVRMPVFPGQAGAL